MNVLACMYPVLVELLRVTLEPAGVEVDNYPLPSQFMQVFGKKAECGRLPDAIITGSRLVGTGIVQEHASSIISLAYLNRIPLVVVYTCFPQNYRDVQKVLSTCGSRTQIALVAKNGEPRAEADRIRELMLGVMV